jgi:DNA adenine methylase
MSLIDLSCRPKPFLKWAGGKAQLLNHLKPLIPHHFNNYFEPFLGGGAMFFYLSSNGLLLNKSYLTDINEDLINVYKCLKKSPEILLAKLIANERNYLKDPLDFYYKLRRTVYADNFEKAAQFITLNKTCYNGLYRVNKEGKFNVPMGRYKKPMICDVTNLRNVHLALDPLGVKIECTDYGHVLKRASEGDFIYLDPPFSPISKTSNFTEYTTRGFGTKDQENLARIFTMLCEKKCRVIVSNSDTKLVRDLYKEYKMITVSSLRSINCQSNRRRGTRELIICN